MVDGENIFLPKCSDGESCCFSGDPRVNEQPHLTFLHTFFHRLFNFISLKIKNSVSGQDKSDEIIFQLARRLTIAFLNGLNQLGFTVELAKLDASGP